MSDAARADERLRDALLKGVAPTLALAIQLDFLAHRIGDVASTVNDAGLGGFFGPVQAHAAQYQTVVLCRLFAKPNRRNRIRSIPVLLDLLEQHGPSIQISYPQHIERYLEPKRPSRRLQREDGEPLATRFATAVRASIPHHALATHKKMRDKLIAHSEAVTLAEADKATWADATALIECAKRFVVPLCSAIWDNGWNHDFEYGYVRIPTAGLDELLERLDLIRPSV